MDPEYERALATWKIKHENWLAGGGKDSLLPPPKEPKAPKAGTMPFWLDVYLKCQRWDTMLCAGGLMDQPDWSFELMDLAGIAYAAKRN